MRSSPFIWASVGIVAAFWSIIRSSRPGTERTASSLLTGRISTQIPNGIGRLLTSGARNARRVPVTDVPALLAADRSVRANAVGSGVDAGGWWAAPVPRSWGPGRYGCISRAAELQTSQNSASIRVPPVPILGQGKAANRPLGLHPRLWPSIAAGSPAVPRVRLRLPTIPLLGRTLAEGWRYTLRKSLLFARFYPQIPHPLPLICNSCVNPIYAYNHRKMNSLQR